jgi:hypothetical protein
MHFEKYAIRHDAIKYIRLYHLSLSVVCSLLLCVFHLSTPITVFFSAADTLMIARSDHHVGLAVVFEKYGRVLQLVSHLAQTPRL